MNNDDEWIDVKEPVEESGMSLNEMLYDWSKMMEGYYIVEQK